MLENKTNKKENIKIENEMKSKGIEMKKKNQRTIISNQRIQRDLRIHEVIQGRIQDRKSKHRFTEKRRFQNETVKILYIKHEAKQRNL